MNKDFYTEQLEDLERYMKIYDMWTGRPYLEVHLDSYHPDGMWIDFDEPFRDKFGIWLKNKIQESAEQVMELNP